MANGDSALGVTTAPPPAQAAVPNNNAMYEIINGPKWQVFPVIRPPKTSPIQDWDLSLKMMRHVWTIEEEEEEFLLRSPPVISNGDDKRLVLDSLV